MSPHVLGDGRLAHRDAQVLKLPVYPWRTPERIRGGHLSNQRTNVVGHGWAAEAVAALPRPEQTNSAPVPRDHGSGLTRCTAKRQPRHVCESHAHNTRSADVKRRRGRLDRCTTASWCRSAMISRCSETRERTMNRSEWSSEARTGDTKGGYRRTLGTSIDTTRTVISAATSSGGRYSSCVAR
jgi:hypothetical protein